ncbi:transposase [Rhodococcus erythropolis]|uniref:RNA-guided endonuclease InsQ/TnpB family protein n=1 Tax=Rhodococcus erythropolis TaxID=1833 RepID=UPI001BA6F010|nr:RNA-guided endonuclease TnpB family protein [Rhodococcus erythropolis]MBS2993585.1 transposase [Rhodococcus erythropolis]
MTISHSSVDQVASEDVASEGELSECMSGLLSVMRASISVMSIVQRVYPVEGAQLDALVMHCDHARLVYNLGLEQRSWWTQSRRHFRQKINYVSQAADLTEARREFDWLRAGSTVVQQGALRDLDRAFTNFFARRAWYPTFKKRSNTRQGFVVRDLAARRVNRKWGEILVPKAGWVRFRISRAWTDICAATSARVAVTNGRWTVSLTTPPAVRKIPDTTAVVGIDRGVANSVATSDGRMFHAPGLTAGEQTRFLALQQRLARQQKGSANRERTKAKLGRLRLRLADRRGDWIEQTTTALASAYCAAAVEKLAIANRTRRAKPKPDPDRPGAFLPNGGRAKSGLNHAILSSCWGKFAQRLDHKMSVIVVSAAYTSQQCSNCGHTCPDNRDSQAVFRCQGCGFEHHADTNAAINIRDRAFIIDHQPEGMSGDRVHQSRLRAAPTTSVP